MLSASRDLISAATKDPAALVKLTNLIFVGEGCCCLDLARFIFKWTL